MLNKMMKEMEMKNLKGHIKINLKLKYITDRGPNKYYGMTE